MELTTKQKWRLRALYGGGYKYLATNESGDTYAYTSKPNRLSSMWYFSDEACRGRYIDEDFGLNLTKWEDEEPLNIKKALGIKER